MKFTKPLVSLCVAGALFATSLSADPVVGKAVCKTATRGGSSLAQIVVTSLATIYNIFPIKVGGVNLDFFPDMEDISSVSDVPVCVCLTPVPRPGLKISLWEPLSIIETTAVPYCSPTIGTDLPIPIGFGAGSYGSNEADRSINFNTYQAHYIKYPIFKLLGLFMDFVCLEPSGGMDYAYITELDPLWQNDIWAAIIGPEAFLVANPIAQAACMVDAVTASVGFPLDPLWWCLGSWPAAFPMTMNAPGTTFMPAQAAITSRMLMKMHRQLLLWGSIGEAGLCQYFPMPIMRKSQYSIFPMYPFPWPFRIPIGRAGIVWEVGQDNPANQHVGAWAVYRKRDCCAF